MKLKKYILISVGLLAIFSCSNDLFEESKYTTVYIGTGADRSVRDLFQQVLLKGKYKIEITAPGQDSIAKTGVTGEIPSFKLLKNADWEITLTIMSDEDLPMFRGKADSIELIGNELVITIILEKLNGTVTFDPNGGKITIAGDQISQRTLTMESVKEQGFPLFDTLKTGYAMMGYEGENRFFVTRDDKENAFLFDIDGDGEYEGIFKYTPDTDGIFGAMTDTTLEELEAIWPVTDMTLKAKWGYYVAYYIPEIDQDVYAGTWLYPENQPSPKVYLPETTISVEDYTVTPYTGNFIGWMINGTGSLVVEGDSFTVNSNIEMVAQFEGI